MEKLFNVPVELFQLEKVKLNKNKTASIDFSINDDRGDSTLNFKCKGFEPNYQTTMELQEKLNDLKPYTMKIRGNPDNQHAKVMVDGVIWTGEGDKEAFKIISSKLSDSDQSMNNDTCKIHVVDNEFGFENDVRDVICDLEKLVHAYIFEGEKAQITMGLTPIEDDEEESIIDVEEVEPEEVE